MHRSPIYRSNCNGEIFSGNAKSLENKYALKGYEAERMRDYALAHTYFQHSEHWKRIAKGEK
jgi:hypothetical protein